MIYIEYPDEITQEFEISSLSYVHEESIAAIIFAISLSSEVFVFLSPASLWQLQTTGYPHLV